MFSKSNKANAGRERRTSPSIIGADCTITGDILSQGEVHVDGRVDGDVRCDMLVVGPSGTITGEISAELVRVLGSVTGQIKARAVELAKSAHVVGDITHESLSIEAGAFVEGRFDRLAEQKALPSGDRNAAGQALLSSPAETKDEIKKEEKPEETSAASEIAPTEISAATA
ncbi:MAG TPA: polymer-forming cytoskeletal protein [Candidatus Sulfotelmatobacter sp.]|jgi:cytoskeletal protein CcmA (bactofilin family)|nr:polymer-forming cytoskeletal protein [Candidatus Sulfotelmatobacter sp.]